MNNTKPKKVFAAVLAPCAIASALVLGTAPAAHATGDDCVNYLHSQRYKIVPAMKKVCAEAAKIGKPGHPACVEKLRTLGVSLGEATEACDRAINGVPHG